MRARDSKIAKYALRILFVAGLLSFGFFAEKQWQNFLHEAGMKTSAGSKRKVVLIGGSIAAGLAPAIERHWRRIDSGSDVEIVDMAAPLMSSDEALARARSAMKSESPRALLFMIGLNEDANRDQWSAEARRLLEAGHFQALADHFRAGFQTTSRFARYFVMQNRIAIMRNEGRSLLLEAVLEHMDRLASRQANGEVLRDEIFNIVQVGVILSTTSRNFPTERPSPETMAEQFEKKLEALISQTRDWRREKAGAEYDAFVASSDPADAVLRRWFWLTWPRDAATLDPIVHYSNRTDDFSAALEFPASVRTQEGVDRYVKDPANHALMSAYIRILEERQRKTESASSLIREERALETLVKAVQDLGAKPVLVHYPAFRLPQLDALSERLSVPAIGTKTRLTDLVRENGRTPYFLDKLHETGHLTDVGLDIYGRDLAEDLSRMAL